MKTDQDATRSLQRSISSLRKPTMLRICHDVIRWKPVRGAKFYFVAGYEAGRQKVPLLRDGWLKMIKVGDGYTYLNLRQHGVFMKSNTKYVFSVLAIGRTSKSAWSHIVIKTRNRDKRKSVNTVNSLRSSQKSRSKSNPEPHSSVLGAMLMRALKTLMGYV